MRHYKILPDSSLKGNLQELDASPLEFNNYLISIAFRRNEYCLLSTLQLRFNSSSQWKIVTGNIGAHEGEITIELGNFNPQNVLQLFWIINAPLTKLNAVVIYLINKESKKMVRVKPSEGVKTIEKGKNWSDENQNISLNF